MTKIGTCQITNTHGYTELHHIIGRDSRGLCTKHLGCPLKNYTPYIIEVSKPIHDRHTSTDNTRAFVQYIYDQYGQAELEKFIDCCDILGTYPKLRLQAFALLVRVKGIYYKPHTEGLTPYRRRAKPKMPRKKRVGDYYQPGRRVRKPDTMPEDEYSRKIVRHTRRVYTLMAFQKRTKLSNPELAELLDYQSLRDTLNLHNFIRDATWDEMKSKMRQYKKGDQP